MEGATTSRDVEMESYVQVEDQDSRDSGISLAQSTTSQQSCFAKIYFPTLFDFGFKQYSLDTVERPQVPHKAFRSINADTMANLLGSLTEEQFQRRFILIDCRYPYEYDAGHIWYSMNLWETASIEKLFYPEEEERFGEIIVRTPIFYCEYSQKRGPKMALALREFDRVRNESRYPYVDYKEIYLLDRGYRYFFKERKFSKYCTPQAYVQMWDSAYTEQRKRFDSHRRGKKGGGTIN
ncbi:hypothetical protein niasHS_011051 [Heterodera schachtii]|uniref:protein-tyrosine-phosphatase n=1 Tax=Heterodera schachtii TaxID=97005 RepID=A0ABD2ITC1_HETSC